MIFRFIRRWKARRKAREINMAVAISVGMRNDGTIDVDIETGDTTSSAGTWNFNNLSLEEAQFLSAELEQSIQRLKAWKERDSSVLKSRTP
jgi:hypothetical protein